MTSRRFDELFGAPPRAPGELLTQRHMDIAASIQAVTDEAVLRLTRAIAAETGLPNLCLAGGVALNCVANGKVLRDRRFERLWIQPAAGDAGGALGAALCAYHHFKGQRRAPQGPLDAMQGSYLGPAYAQEVIEQRLKKVGAAFAVLGDGDLIEATVQALVDSQAVGWFQGRMEFGPRALGARSILGDPRSPAMQSALNLKVKYRESFRPFAPSVLAEEAAEWFDLDAESPYMLIIAGVLDRHRRAMTEAERALFGIEKLNVPRSSIPAVTHVDYSARIQTVHRETNPRYHALLAAFRRRTGCPILVNTSFNVRGEPIVCTPEDAFRCFMGTEIEALAIGNCFLRKEDQDPRLKLDYRDRFDPD
jgi:carbamoyltransferase